MGNILRCFEGEEDHQDRLVFHSGWDQYPYHRPLYHSDDQPTAAPRPRPHQQARGPHGVTPATFGFTTALTQAAGSNIGHLQGSNGVLANRVVASQPGKSYSRENYIDTEKCK
uniref:Uncharacterized protein n=1 Tax=Arundo donax TaxID=35708 RepID=A0A0A9DBN6_ARUDO